MINYLLLTKPGIVFGNLITLMAGFLLASKTTFNSILFLTSLAGLSCIMASACVFNNYIDRNIDKRMKRTRERPLVTGLINHRHALIFAIFLGITGYTILFVYTNALTLAIAAIGFFIYVVLYSLWKQKTVFATAIGSLAGAIPPVVGYCAVSNQIDPGAILLFMLMVFWQMPHFFSIALYRLDDYRKAGIPVLPLEKGVFRTKIHMCIYILLFIPTTLLLTYYQYTGLFFFVTVFICGLCWLGLALRGFQVKDDQKWGRQMFQFSLITLMAISVIIPLDIVN